MSQREVIGKRIIGCGKWIRLLEVNYCDSMINPDENTLKWEMVERTTKTSSGVDSIRIKLMLIKTFIFRR